MAPRRRTAFVTGGNRGIGLAVCRALAASGLHVIVGARDRAAAETTARALRAGGLPADAATIDVTDRRSIARCIAGLKKKRVHVDVLVNNAGIYHAGKIRSVDMRDVREAMEVHYFGPLALIRGVLPAMERRGYGRIVNVSSGCGSFGEGLECDGAYSISKAAMNALTCKLSQELTGDVKVNALCPGWVRTRMGGSKAPRTPEKGAETIVWLATLPKSGPTGGYFRDRKRIPW
jgi:NAD(P)-dependent dehydrogenase (short-subunit alcohol dehydrogenase family)